MAYSPPMAKLIIISGGQTGVDRAALDVAMALGIAYGGWCPQGGWAEDFPRRPVCGRAIRCCAKHRAPIRPSARNGTCATATRV